MGLTQLFPSLAWQGIKEMKVKQIRELKGKRHDMGSKIKNEENFWSKGAFVCAVSLLETESKYMICLLKFSVNE